MHRILCAFIVALFAAVGPAQASASAISDETAEPDQASDKAKPELAAAAAADEEFVPPPGFKPRKFGDKTLYCRKDTTVGTRFKTEKCFDEAQMRDFILAQEQSNRDFDRARAICATPAVCRIE